MNDLHKFRFKSKEECAVFEQLLSDYSDPSVIKINTPPMLSYFNLEKAYEKFVDGEEYDESIFAWIFDIKLSYFFVSLATSRVWAVHNFLNDQIMGKISKPTTCIENPDLFFAHMEFQRLLPDFTLRYRALWDKLMNLLNIYYIGKHLNGKSKLKAFRLSAEKIDEIPNDFVEGLAVLIDAFNNMYRTSEAHKSGVFRNSSFITLPRGFSSPIDIISLFQGSMNHAVMLISLAVIEGVNMPKVPFPDNPEPESQGYFHVLRNELEERKNLKRQE